MAGTTVLSYVGDNPPASRDDWTLEGNFSKNNLEVAFDADLAPGTKVWFTGFYFNTRMISGPMAQPVMSHIGFGGLSMAA